MQELARYGDLVGQRRPDGSVTIAAGADDEVTLGRDDRLGVEFGGLAAAVGIVPLRAWHWSAVTGQRRTLLYEEIDEDCWDVDASALAEELLVALESIAQAAGCVLIED